MANRHPAHIHPGADRAISANEAKVSIAQVEPRTSEFHQRRVLQAARQFVDLDAIVNRPEIMDFLSAAKNEAAHQRDRWPEGHDEGKSPADWFWTLGYLAQKAMHAHENGDADKLKHHLITSAALMANWHAVALAQFEENRS